MTDDGFFGDDIAASYDSVHGASDTESVRSIVRVLGEFAEGGTALEFAIGTGRIALPLLEMGVAVKGIEMSKAMVEQLYKKENGTTIKVVIGDMTTARVGGEFSLVFLVYNTIDNLTSQDAQLACFKNAYSHLQPGGRFVIETLVPPIQKMPVGETKLAFNHTADHWGIDEIDIVTQQYTSHHVRFENGKYRKVSVPFRYAWPAEFDLMAKTVGLELEHRWSDWNKAAFTNTSTAHISVWRRPAD